MKNLLIIFLCLKLAEKCIMFYKSSIDILYIICKSLYFLRSLLQFGCKYNLEIYVIANAFDASVKAMVSWFPGWRIFHEPIWTSRSVGKVKIKKNSACPNFYLIPENWSRSVGKKKLIKKDTFYFLFII